MCSHVTFSHRFIRWFIFARVHAISEINRYSGRAGCERIAFQHEHHHCHSSHAENGGLYRALAGVGSRLMIDGVRDSMRFYHFVFFCIF